MKKCDFLVIGAGIAGASAAYELAAMGSVVVLERESAPGYHTTGRSAALYVERYGKPAIYALTRASRPFLESPPEGLAEHPLLTPRGRLWIGRPDQEKSLAAALALPGSRPNRLRRIELDEALALVPVLRREYLTAAVLDPDTMDIDVHALHQVFLKGLRGRGGEVVTDAEVTGLGWQGGQWEVVTEGESYSAPVVVNAAGAWCDEVARLAGVRPLGLSPFRRTAFTFDPPEGARPSDWPSVSDVDERFYFKPESGRLMGSTAEETPLAPCDVRPEDRDVAEGVERIERATTMRIPRVARKWAGLRTFAPDRVPVVGMAPDAAGFFWLAGQGGNGIMTSPAMGRLSAALIAGRGIPPDLADLGVREADLSPARFGKISKEA